MLKDQSELFSKYLQAREVGKNTYFDVKEIEDLLLEFEKEDNFEYYHEVLDLGLRLHPNNPKLTLKRCEQLMAEAKYQEALEILNQHTFQEKMHRQFSDQFRLQCLCHLGRFNKANEYMQQLIDSHCEYLDYMFVEITILLVLLGEEDRAEDFMKWGESVLGKPIDLKFEVCNSLGFNNHLDQAIDLCNTLIEDDVLSPDYWASLGMFYAMDCKFEEAIEAFDNCLACLKEPSAEICAHKAFSLYMNENYEKALEIYQDLREQNYEKQDPHTLIFEGGCHFELGDFKKAYDLFSDAINKPYSLQEAFEIEAYTNLIVCCLELGYKEEMSRFLRQATKKYKANTNFEAKLMCDLFEHDQETLGKEFLDKLLKHLQTDNVNPEKISKEFEFLLQVVQLFLQQNRNEEALELFQEIKKLNPQKSSLSEEASKLISLLDKTDKPHEEIEQSSDESIMKFLQKTTQKEVFDTNFPHEFIDPETIVDGYLKNKNHDN